MVPLPVLIPVTAPLPLPILNNPVAVLQIPPGVPSVSVTVAPTHSAVGPVMEDGSGLTVIVTLPVMVLLHPDDVVATTV